MPTEESDYEILEGTPIEATTTLTIIDAESAGIPFALRTLTHPTTGTFPIVTYNRNPDRTLNFDQFPLYPPTSTTLRTLDGTRVFTTQNALDDVLVTEIWEGNNRRAPMATAQFRRLYELAINPPPITNPETFLVWAPADRTTTTYNVIITDLRVGGGSGQLDVKDVGLLDAGVVDALATGLMDRTVELDLKLVSEVPV